MLCKQRAPIFDSDQSTATLMAECSLAEAMRYARTAHLSSAGEAGEAPILYMNGWDVFEAIPELWCAGRFARRERARGAWALRRRRARSLSALAPAGLERAGLCVLRRRLAVMNASTGWVPPRPHSHALSPRATLACRDARIDQLPGTINNLTTPEYRRLHRRVGMSGAEGEAALVKRARGLCKLFVGPRGAITRMHQDNHHAHAWLTNIR